MSNLELFELSIRVRVELRSEGVIGSCKLKGSFVGIIKTKLKSSGCHYRCHFDTHYHYHCYFCYYYLLLS